MNDIQLSSRLRELYLLIPQDCQILWDICCDHGYIGRKALMDAKFQFDQVCFVDQIPVIMQKLENHCHQESHYYRSDYSILCQDARCFDFQTSSNSPRQCFLIAGVGSHTIKAILKSIHQEYVESELEGFKLILGPQKHNDSLRQELHQLGWKSIKETIVFENGHFRELWLVGRQGSNLLDFQNIATSHLDVWIQYWKELLIRMLEIQKKGGVPEYSPKDLQELISKHS